MLFVLHRETLSYLKYTQVTEQSHEPFPQSEIVNVSRFPYCYVSKFPVKCHREIIGMLLFQVSCMHSNAIQQKGILSAQRQKKP